MLTVRRSLKSQDKQIKKHNNNNNNNYNYNDNNSSCVKLQYNNMPLLLVFGFEATYYHESGTFLKFSFKDRGTYSIFLDISKCMRNVLNKIHMALEPVTLL